MTIHLSWDDAEQTTLRMEMSDGWRIEDLYEQRRQIEQMLAVGDHDIYLIIDVTRTHLVPSGLLSYISHRTADNKPWNPRVQRVIVATQNAFLRKMFQMVSVVYRRPIQQFEMVDTLDEAHQRIRTHQQHRLPM